MNACMLQRSIHSYLGIIIYKLMGVVGEPDEGGIYIMACPYGDWGRGVCTILQRSVEDACNNLCLLQAFSQNTQGLYCFVPWMYIFLGGGTTLDLDNLSKQKRMDSSFILLLEKGGTHVEPKTH